MQRTIVQVMQVRMCDVLPGDIVNKKADSPIGWFECTGLHDLPNNGIVVQAHSDRDSVNGTIYDMIGVQITKVVEVPDSQPKAA